MLTHKVKEHSVVLLSDGRKGTVVHLYSAAPDAYCVEIDDDTHELVDVLFADIAKVLWVP